MSITASSNISKIRLLMKELKSSKEPSKKRKIRMRLRKLGHYGGLLISKLLVTKGESRKLISRM